MCLDTSSRSVPSRRKSRLGSDRLVEQGVDLGFEPAAVVGQALDRSSGPLGVTGGQLVLPRRLPIVGDQGPDPQVLRLVGQSGGLGGGFVVLATDLAQAAAEGRQPIGPVLAAEQHAFMVPHAVGAGTNLACFGWWCRGWNPAMDPISSVQTISAVTLVTADMRVSVGFYQSLGFTVRYGGPDVDFTSFHVGSGYLNLQLDPARAPIADIWGRVVFWVDDVDQLHQRAMGAGYRPLTVPADAPWGERYFHLRDPDGHELSFARLLDAGR